MLIKYTFLACVIFLLTLTSQPGKVESKKILALEFFGSKSHVITYLSLMEELARSGHEVTVVGPGKGLTKEKSIKEIFTFDFDIFWKEDNRTLFQIKESNEDINPFTFLTQMLPKFCGQLYDRPDIKALMNENFDLILIQPLFNDCSLGLVHKINKKNAHLVLFSPTSLPSFLASMTGGHHPTSFVANTFLGYSDEMSFFERFINTGSTFLMDLVFSFYYLPVMESVYREKLGSDIPSAKEILGNASLVLSNGHYSISRPKPNLPDVVDVGGIHSRDAKPLPKDLEDFIAKGSDNGFILFSLGSGIKASEMNEKKRQIFLNVFSRLKQRIIWKYESNIPDLPENIYLSKWLPQQDLLGHPKIRFFITHCGGGGNEESIYHGVPLLGMPFFGDQPLNAKGAQKQGYLYLMDWNNLTEENLMEGIQEVLNNPKYRENVKKLSKIFKDQIDKPLERGLWWMEYIMRHNGAPQLRSEAARKLNYFQYHSLDVLAAYSTIILVSLLVVWKVLKALLSMCRSVFVGNPTKKGTLVQNGKKYN